MQPLMLSRRKEADPSPLVQPPSCVIPYKKGKTGHKKEADGKPSTEVVEMTRHSNMTAFGKDKSVIAYSKSSAVPVSAHPSQQPTPNKRPNHNTQSQISPMLGQSVCGEVPKYSFEQDEVPLFKVGDMVEVARRKMPSFNFDGGAAIIKKVNDESGIVKPLKDGSHGGIRTTRLVISVDSKH